MTDAVVGAAAPAEHSSAPIEQVTAPPTPLSETTPPPAAEIKAEPPKPAPSTRDALRAAAAKVEAGEAGKATADPAKDLAKGADLDRAKDGKFAPKDPAAGKDAKTAAAVPEGKPAADAESKDGAKPAPVATKPAATDPNAPKHAAPERFSPDAKAAWETAPEPVKAEVHRMQRELTQGIEKHRTAAERDGTLAEFHDMAGKAGKPLRAVVEAYVGMETLLRQNPLKGLEAVCSNIGVSLRDVAQIVLGQTPDQERSQADSTIRELRQELNQLKQQVGGVTQHFQQQGENQLHNQIASWAGSREGYFEVIAPHVAAEMRDGATDLDDAEARVFQKHPALAALAKQAAKPAADPEPDPAASSAAAAALLAQTEKGTKSIKGAPGSGSEPAAQPRSSSIKEALKRAAAKAG